MEDALTREMLEEFLQQDIERAQTFHCRQQNCLSPEMVLGLQEQMAFLYPKNDDKPQFHVDGMNDEKVRFMLKRLGMSGSTSRFPTSFEGAKQEVRT